MDGGEEEFMSDDGGGTPVQDEHPQSDGEEMRSDGQQSEDDGSNDEDAAIAMETGGAANSSDAEDRHRADSDSEDEAPGGRRDKSDSEAEPHRPGDSEDEDSPAKHRASASDEEEEESPTKRRPSGSEDEASSPVKRGASDNEEEEEDVSSPAKRRGSSSELEDAPGGDGARSDSDNEEDKPAPASSPRQHSDSDSDAEPPARRQAAPMDSDEEDEGKQEEEEGVGGGKWKGVMQSDSEDEEDEGQRKKAATGSDEEQREEEKKQQRDDSEEEDDKPVKRKKAILSDSEDEDEEKEDKPAAKRSRAVSDDDENSGSSDGSVGPDRSLAAKLRELGSDSGSDEEDRSKPTAVKKDEKALFGSDSDSGKDDEEEKMIADIFGESGDEEEEEFTGFNQEELEAASKQPKQQQQAADESDSDEEVDRSGQDTSFMSDFDIMLAKRKAMNSRKRRHRDGGTFISDADDVVSAMITKMNEAAEEDRTLNSQKKPALKKLTLLPQVVMHLKKQDLKETFIDSGVMSAIKEWISPLPDKSLPALRIREELLRILQELPNVSQETLKHSGIGRAVMFLYKHPKESRANKDLALKLINEWSRPIFGLTSNYKGMTREERQQRDLDQQTPQRRRLSEPQKVERAQEPDVFSPPTSSGGQTPRRDLEKQLTGEEKALRPGDPGFCARARVPMPSNKDYVVRPKWNVEGDSSRGPVKKGLSRVDKQMRRFADIRRLTKTGHAVKISVEGNRMPL
ncbi:protein IWS1 homolog isoform X1 [Poecilia formosa]|uniref:Interacts with SUPT6H, CTD assembly factor 1 n=2 Tax=Poecilia formosa TaxID=48698 RepID=A0A087XVH6_POEFO|nr:PREDICTED: protein IWS1 homolog isoform X1 [Poecilia formosa]